MLNVGELILVIINTPLLSGVLVWIIKVEKRLSVIETTCKLRNAICSEEKIS